MLSRLGFHNLKGTSEARKIVEAGCWGGIVVDDFGGGWEYKVVNPNITVIGRRIVLYEDGRTIVTDSNLKEQGLSPQAAADRHDQLMDMTYNLNPQIEIWAGLNEPKVDTLADVQWYSAFEVARIGHLKRRQKRAAVGAFSTGTPNILDLSMCKAFLPALRAAHENNGLFNKHEYWVGRISDKFDHVTGEGFDIFGFVKWRKQILIPEGLGDLPIILGECGADYRRDPNDSWAYADDLMILDNELVKYPKVYACIYTFGDNSTEKTWKDFNVEGDDIVTSRIVGRIQGIKPLPEPTYGPAEPPPSTKFSVDDLVNVTHPIGLNVRETPAGKILGNQVFGTVGRVIAGPVRANLGTSVINWWSVLFENGPSGWMSEVYLEMFVPIPDSTKFSRGDRVAVTHKIGLNVREKPAGKRIGGQPFGSMGMVIDGPVRADLLDSSIVWWLVNNDEGTDGWMSEEFLEKVPPQEELLEGMDVSYYQGTIDWGKVAASGISFAFIRVSDGLGAVDKQFDRNWLEAKKNGIIRGAYQYFRASQDPKAQAELVLSKILPFQDGDFVPVLDIETQNGMTVQQLLSGVEVWINTVRVALGNVPVILYGRKNQFDTWGMDKFNDNELWVANYDVDSPAVPNGWNTFSFWQYQVGDPGSVPGVSTSVDRDRFNGSLEDLHAFLDEHTPAPAEPPHERRPITFGNGSFEEGWITDEDGSKTGAVKNQIPNRWGIHSYRSDEALRFPTKMQQGNIVPAISSGKAGEYVHKGKVSDGKGGIVQNLPDDEMLGQKHALVLNGDTTFKDFAGGNPETFANDLFQEFTAEPGEIIEAVVPICGESNDKPGSPTGKLEDDHFWVQVSLNGVVESRNYATMVLAHDVESSERAWNVFRIQARVPNDGKCKLNLYFQQNWPGVADFFIDKVQINYV